ncbi:Calmodulin, related [Neospora caninum Liverpool]|uniref:Calmodulin n=1 Tax=Neospora caninum (strain Liverpool) TaxID=572307 RepID=F0VLW9_NEOCL|nr:Calmodulin, related [Neospora caninum Liverpool]CBZ54247.1 Calmodulin, related [Neospora caninum Liverpool]CEL68951.1 TPA: EF-hand calcium-binding domain containing protein [Neospora caninum Liverpool]|eukprot:XP_003884278.1 Calmodulin, related [Neospora caninum Liverpool]
MAEFQYLCKFCFTLMDEDGDGKVKVSQLGTMLRMLGQIWSYASILTVENELGNRPVTLDTFLRIAKQKRMEEAKARKKPISEQMMNMYGIPFDIGLSRDEINELKVCFDVFDPEGRGVCSVKDVSQVLSCLGEQLSPSDVEKLLALENLDRAEHLRFADFCAIFSRLQQ